MNIFGKLSLIFYAAAFCFMGFGGRYFMGTSYEGVGIVISLLLILAGAFLAPLQKRGRSDPEAEREWEKELDELERMLEEKRAMLENKQEIGEEDKRDGI